MLIINIGLQKNKIAIYQQTDSIFKMSVSECKHRNFTRIGLLYRTLFAIDFFLYYYIKWTLTKCTFGMFMLQQSNGLYSFMLFSYIEVFNLLENSIFCILEIGLFTHSSYSSNIIFCHPLWNIFNRQETSYLIMLNWQIQMHQKIWCYFTWRKKNEDSVKWNLCFSES